MKKVLVIGAVITYIGVVNHQPPPQPSTKHQSQEQAWCAKEWSKYRKRIKGYKVLHVDNPVGQAKSDLLAEAIFKGYDCPQTDG